MPSIDELKALAQQKLRQRGMEWFWPAMDYIYTRESGWNPQAHNTRGEDSVGLGQMNRAGGMGVGYSVEQLMDPSFNMDLMLDHVQGAVAKGATLQDALQPWSTTHGIDAASLIKGGGNMVTPTTTAPTGDITQKVIAWLDKMYPVDVNGKPQGAIWFSQDPQGWTDYYRKNVLGETAAAEAPAPISEYQAGELQLGAGQLAVSQGTLDLAVKQFEADEKQRGTEWALQKFVDTISAAQEGRTAAQAAVEYERQFAPVGMTESPYGGKGSAYAQYMTEHGVTPREPMQYQPTNLPRTYQEATTMFTPPTPEYAPAAPPMGTPPMPTPTPVGTTGGTVPTTTPQLGYQGPSADVLAGVGLQPGGPNMTPTPQNMTAIPPEMLMTQMPGAGGLGMSQALREALRRLGLMG